MFLSSSGWCANCPRNYFAIGGDGQQPCPLLLIGERPGRDEQKRGRVFVGKTGEELNETYLARCAGLDRALVRVVNCVRCYADSNKTPTAKEIASCAPYHLPDELRETKPELVILMGTSACSLVPGIRLEMHHGLPRKASLFGWEGWVIPMYHPSIGLHESKWMTVLLEDWESLRKILDSEFIEEAVIYHTDYHLITSPKEIDIATDLPIAVDTERHGSRPFSVQYSQRPGSARMVLADDHDSLSRLREILHGIRESVVFHFAVHDLDELEAMGIREIRSYDDTLQQAYHLGNLPQALKVLTYRLFHFTMTSWEDVVWPASISALMSWMAEALYVASSDLKLTEVTKLKTKTRLTSKSCSMESLLTRLIQHTTIDGEYDPWSRLAEFYADESNSWMTERVFARCGPYPILGIGNAPLDQAVAYGCGDAAWTLQCSMELARRRQSDRFKIFEGDRDL